MSFLSFELFTFKIKTNKNMFLFICETLLEIHSIRFKKFIWSIINYINLGFCAVREVGKIVSSNHLYNFLQWQLILYRGFQSWILYFYFTDTSSIYKENYFHVHRLNLKARQCMVWRECCLSWYSWDCVFRLICN